MYIYKYVYLNNTFIKEGHSNANQRQKRIKKIKEIYEACDFFTNLK